MSSESLDISNYIYSKGNLLDEPQTYQKSPFLGIKFLKLYKQSRLDILNKLYISDHYFNYENFVANIQHKHTSNSTIELEHYLTYLLKESTPNPNSVDIVLKKFEVKKQLFTKYDLNFKEISNDFKFMRNYLLLAFLCIELYRKNHSLKYLNCCLKINDTVISQLFNLTSNDQKLLKYSIQNELDFIERLCIKKGINL